MGVEPPLLGLHRSVLTFLLIIQTVLVWVKETKGKALAFSKVQGNEPSTGLSPPGELASFSFIVCKGI